MLEDKKRPPLFWTQFDCTGNLCLRLVTHASPPPPVTIDEKTIQLRLRASPNPSFPVFVWEIAVPLGSLIEIEGVRVAIPLYFKKIGFLGDTGCRPDQESTPDKWPFKKIVAALIKEQPTLIIHLGDYIYRHFKAQLKSDQDLIYETEGDNWSGWQKEFFTPVGTAVSQVPWVFIRGNQESNECAPEGWFRFFDGYPYTSACPNYTPAYVISLDTANLIVHDSSYLHPDQELNWPDKQLSHLNLDPGREAWLLTHRPLWGIVNNQGENDSKPLIIMNEHSNLQPYMEPFPSSLTTIFSGHIHAFQAIKLASTPIQLYVIGNGGVCLEKAAPPEILMNTHLENKKIDSAVSLIQSGYGVAECKSKSWRLIVKNAQANILYTSHSI